MTLQNTRGWLSNFFGGANQLRWLDVEGGTLPDNWSVEIAAWLTLLEREPNPAILLPLLDVSGGVTWYAVGTTQRAVHALAEDLGGFVGQTYGGFTGRPHEPTAAEPAAMVLAAEFPAPMYRIGPISGSDIDGIWRSLARYRRLIDRRPGAARLPHHRDIHIDRNGRPTCRETSSPTCSDRPRLPQQRSRLHRPTREPRAQRRPFRIRVAQ